MSSGPSLLRSKLIQAFAVVLTGGLAITALNVTLLPTSKPYYAVIATQRVAAQVEIKKSADHNTYDTNSRASSK